MLLHFKIYKFCLFFLFFIVAMVLNEMKMVGDSGVISASAPLQTTSGPFSRNVNLK